MGTVRFNIDWNITTPKNYVIVNNGKNLDTFGGNRALHRSARHDKI